MIYFSDPVIAKPAGLWQFRCPPPKNNPLARHFRAGGNPVKNIRRSRQYSGVEPLHGTLFNHLDSRLRGNDTFLCQWIIWV